ncbi:MAG: flagellar hook-length control protein FliK [Deltaproteobacteria bacterium]|nr:flagellar hook-length control protein FliK [Deltaproteobacteria bacterium]
MIPRIRSTLNALSPKLLSPRQVRLEQGETFQGRIVRHYGNNRVQVAFRGSSFQAVTDLKVREGEEYTFRVKSTGERITLVVEKGPRTGIPLPAGRGERMAAILSDLASSLSLKNIGPETRHLLRVLTQALPSLIYRDREGDPSLWLSRYFSMSGLFWESKVARALMNRNRPEWKSTLGHDLKGMLLGLQKALGTDDREQQGVRSLCRKVGEAIQIIEECQVENIFSLEEEGGWFLDVPGRAEEGFKRAELFVRGRKEGTEIHLSMSLEFTDLGQVAVIASLAEPFVAVQFLLEDGERAGFLEQNLPLLEMALKGAGLTPGSLMCRVKQAEMIKGGASAEGDGTECSVDVLI